MKEQLTLTLISSISLSATIARIRCSLRRFSRVHWFLSEKKSKLVSAEPSSRREGQAKWGEFLCISQSISPRNRRKLKRVGNGDEYFECCHLLSTTAISFAVLISFAVSISCSSLSWLYSCAFRFKCLTLWKFRIKMIKYNLVLSLAFNEGKITCTLPKQR